MKSLLIPALISLALSSCSSPSPNAISSATNTASAPEIISSNDLPSFTFANDNTPYKADQFLAAAIKLQALEKDEAIKGLRVLATRHSTPDDTIIILCRMLFTAKPDGQFRSPALGAPTIVGGRESFTLVPIEIVEGVPFLVVKGYSLAGVAEPAEVYLNYCVAECDWNTFKYKTKTAAEKTTALDKLVWKHPLSPSEIGLLTMQLE